MKKTIFISWEKHLRTRTLCSKLDIELIEIIHKKNSILRYIYSTWDTYKAITKYRPSILLIQNPSAILAFISNLLKIIFKYKLYIDAHNEAVTPYVNNSFLFRWLCLFNIRKADLTIVTNINLAQIVKNKGGEALILPDIIPTPPIIQPKPNKYPPYKVVLICTYAPDEPYEEVIEACTNLKNVNLYITGKTPTRLKDKSTPPSLVFTGYLAEIEYWSLLFESHIIIDLTEMPDCLVCGAYESISIEKPLILSNNKASLSTFE